MLADRGADDGPAAGLGCREQGGRAACVSPSRTSSTTPATNSVSTPVWSRTASRRTCRNCWPSTSNCSAAGYTLVRREYMTPIGPVDLLCRDEEGRSVAVEIKRRGEIDGVEQLTRYLELLNRDSLLAPVSGRVRRPADQAAGPHAGDGSWDPLRDIGLRPDARPGQRRVPAVLSSLDSVDGTTGCPGGTRSEQPLPPVCRCRGASRPGPTATTTRCGRSPRARATKSYRCPGCDHEIRSGTAHVVVWPADAGEHAARRPAALAYAVLDATAPTAARRASGLSRSVTQAAGSTSSISTPPASLGWMKLIREFAVPRRGTS